MDEKSIVASVALHAVLEPVFEEVSFHKNHFCMSEMVYVIFNLISTSLKRMRGTLLQCTHSELPLQK